MFTNTPFESAVKTMFAGAEKFNPVAGYYTAKVLMANLKAWGDLAQAQAQASQAAAAESVEAFNGIKEPQAAFDALKANAEKGIALAGVAKGMKTAASTMENALESAVLIGLAHTQRSYQRIFLAKSGESASFRG